MPPLTEDVASQSVSNSGFFKAILIYGFITLATHHISSLIAPALVSLAYFIDNFSDQKTRQNILRIIIGLVLYIIISVLPPLLFVMVTDFGLLEAAIIWLLPVLLGAIVLAFTFPNPQFPTAGGIRTALFWSFIAALILGVISLLILGLIVGFVVHTGI